MKSLGIIRRVDNLGRIVLPKETRDSFGIIDNDPIEFYVDNDKIILKKYLSRCEFCTNTEDLVEFKGKKVCNECIAALSKESVNQNN